jgi:hypothetical protein
MAAEVWQAALRRQYGREQNFQLENLGTEPIFPEFRVVNPVSGGRYRVAIRGARLGDNCTPTRPKGRCSRRARDAR